MRLGFSGTRDGMTPEQKDAFRRIVRDLRLGEACEFRQGCCIGADEQATVIVTAETPATVYGHPSDLFRMTSELAIELCDKVYPPKPPLDRNHDIVDFTDVLIATPKMSAEEQRSGTWQAVRCAKKLGRRVVIIWPNGTTQETEART